jgi:hypothetical protein
MSNPLDILKYHVTGAIDRGEKVAIVEHSVTKALPMNKPANEPLVLAATYGNQLRYISKRRFRKLRARHRRQNEPFSYETFHYIDGSEFRSWLRPLGDKQS